MGLQTTSGLCSAVSQSVITAGNSLPMNIYHNYCTINTYIHIYIYIYIIFLRANQNQLGLNSFSLCQNSHHCPHSSHKTKGQSSWMFLSRPTLRNLSRQGQAFWCWDRTSSTCSILLRPHTNLSFAPRAHVLNNMLLAANTNNLWWFRLVS